MSSLEDFKKNFKSNCFQYSLSLLKLSTVIPSKQTNKIILDQLYRSGTSIGANVVEGGSSISKKESISYFQIALKSSSETLYWLSLLKEMNPNIEPIDMAISEGIEIKKFLTSIIINSKRNS